MQYVSRNLFFSFVLKKRFDSHIFDTLLRIAVNNGGCDAWKAIALLLRIVALHKARCTPVLVSLVQAKFRSSLARVLDQTQDFQLAIYLVKMLSFLAPNGETPSTRVRGNSIIHLWEDSRKNKAFFEDSDFIALGTSKHPLFCDFVIKKIGPLSNFGIARAVSYTTRSTSGKSDIKCVQYTCDVIYVWTATEELFEFNLQYFEISATATGVLKLKLLSSPASAISVLDPALDHPWAAATAIFIEFDDARFSQNLLKNCRRQKVSECTSFISVQFNSSSQGEVGESQSFEPLALPTPERESSDALVLPRKKAATPKPSGPPNVVRETAVVPKPLKLVFPRGKIQKAKNKPNNHTVEDEWDFKHSSVGNQAKSALGSPDTHVAADWREAVNGREGSDPEQSPLVMAQKRKQARMNRKNKEALAIAATQQAGITSLGLFKQLCDEIETEKPKGASKSVVVKEHHLHKAKPSAGISEREILQLDSIFNSLGPSAHCKTKKQTANALDAQVKAKEHTKELQKSLPDKKGGKRKAEDLPIANTRATRSKKEIREPLKSAAGNEVDVVVQKPIATAMDPPSVGKIYTSAATAASAAVAAESTNLDATTLTTPFAGLDAGAKTNNLLGSSLTHQLQDQIFSSIHQFADEFTRKMKIINDDFNRKISSELSQKYQLLFAQLQDSFQRDVAQMSEYLQGIKGMLHLPEDQLVDAIRRGRKQFE
ncbi:LAME_0D09846g1_1 [Lachancea meyersii CBS 8951]|uniref:LAME_0D09846g1_1 n=1 Tax=Lachancea meyersii CBS 8951 TaxID=1266667 RepID=A0A1G4JBA4_9SACH|nr:LAME_0D09846g1_1 [Lachancea meyersii CBS 8951]